MKKVGNATLLSLLSNSKSKNLSETALRLRKQSHQYCSDPMFSDRQVRVKSVDQDQMAPEGVVQEKFDQGLHCLPFHMHLLDASLYGNTTL